MVLRSDEQQGQTQSCEMGEWVASLWNELMPRLKQLTAMHAQGDPDGRITDSRLGQGKELAYHGTATDCIDLARSCDGYRHVKKLPAIYRT
jgi:hypothetical protein